MSDTPLSLNRQFLTGPLLPFAVLPRVLLSRPESPRVTECLAHLLTAQEATTRVKLPNREMSSVVSGSFRALEATLGATADERLQWLALAALAAQAGPSQGWSPALRARLVDYHRDSAPLVAAAAQFTLVPLEGDEVGGEDE